MPPKRRGAKGGVTFPETDAIEKSKGSALVAA